MSDIQVSIVASAVRTQFWMELYDSLKGNTINWEIIFVGDKIPNFTLPNNFKFIYSTVKPAQCYEIAFRAAQGETIHWTADDAIYIYDKRVNNLDNAYYAYKEAEKTYNDNKTVVAMRPIEDGGDVQESWHYLFGGNKNTPRMAPLGLMSRQLLLDLGGYDKQFVSGQSENDLVMRVYEVGGRCEFCKEAFIYIGHRRAHENPNMFRQWYTKDRERLEQCWVVPSSDGSLKISKTRLYPVDRFDEKDILTVTQGVPGKWS